MKISGNTILITGAGSGIGLALAGEFSGLGNEVIVAARSPEKLEIAARNGFKTEPADLSDPASIRNLASRVIENYPDLNVVIHNAGISRNENYLVGVDEYQLKETSVEVIELPPPYVQTTLSGDYQAGDPRAMPLAEFVSEAMQILKEQPGAREILVNRVRELRFSADGGDENYQALFEKYNDRIAAAQAAAKQ